MGCHSGKFKNEKSSEVVSHSIAKLQVGHPVINDDKMQCWKLFGVKCWPTLVVFSPKGRPIACFTGEGHREIVETFLNQAVQYFRQELTKIRTFKIEKLATSKYLDNESSLKYPSKLTVMKREKDFPYDSDILVVSDSGNDRVVLIRAEEPHSIVATIGNGKNGFKDGPYSTCQFNMPQGICHVRRQNQHFLYICDMRNHAVREVNLNTKHVKTVAGTGAKSFDRYGGSGPSHMQKLCSPWDIVALNEYELMIAMAGVHQMWILNLLKNRCFAFCGNGKEANKNS